MIIVEEYRFSQEEQLPPPKQAPAIETGQLPSFPHDLRSASSHFTPAHEERRKP